MVIFMIFFNHNKVFTLYKVICQLKDASCPISLELFESSLSPLSYMNEKKEMLNILFYPINPPSPAKKKL